MKRVFRHLTSDIRPLLAATYVLSVTSASSLTEANPYAAIVGRNTFALKPPIANAGPVAPPAAPPPNVSLQGISTILGRAQALLKVKIAPKPPEAAKELSLVLDVGQREGDVEVLAIDPAAGTVSLSNQGTPLTLNIKDADKPVAGPAVVAAAGLPGLPGVNPNPLSAIPTQSLPPSPNPQTKPTTVGGTSVNAPGSTVPSVPTRPLRGAGAGNQNTSVQSTLSLEERAALALVNKEKWKQQGREDIANLIPNPVPQQPVVNPQQ